jgi:hypothetical protein
MISSGRGIDWGLLWLRRATFLVLSIRTSLNIDEILTNSLGKMERAGVLLIQEEQQWAERAWHRLISRPRTSGLAMIAEPFIGQAALDYRRINALEVE